MQLQKWLPQDAAEDGGAQRHPCTVKAAATSQPRSPSLLQHYQPWYVLPLLEGSAPHGSGVSWIIQVTLASISKALTCNTCLAALAAFIRWCFSSCVSGSAHSLRGRVHIKEQGRPTWLIYSKKRKTLLVLMMWSNIFCTENLSNTEAEFKNKFLFFFKLHSISSEQRQSQLPPTHTCTQN